MDVLEELNNYEVYVENNYENVLLSFISQKNPLLDDSENDVYSVIKLLQTTATISYSNDLRLFYFKNFLEKVKIIIANGDKVIFKNGMFDHISGETETYLFKLDKESDAKEFDEFKKNVSYSFFYLIRFFSSVYSEFEKKSFKQNKTELIQQYKDEPHVIEYAKLLTLDKKEQISIYPVKMWDFLDLLKNNSYYNREYIGIDDLNKEDVQDENQLDQDILELLMDDEEKIKKWGEYKKRIKESVSFFQDTPFFNDEIEKIFFRAMFLPKKKRAEIIKQFSESRIVLINLSKSEYIPFKKDAYVLYKETRDYDLMTDVNFLSSLSEEYIIANLRRLKILVCGNKFYIDMISLTKVNNIEDREKVLKAMDALMIINKKELSYYSDVSKEDIFFLSYMREYLYIHEIISNLKIKDKISYLNNRTTKGLLGIEGLNWSGLNIASIKREVISNALERNEISYSDGVDNEVMLYTKSFLIENDLCSYIMDDIESDNLKIKKVSNDRIKIVISWNKALSLVECMEIIKELYPRIGGADSSIINIAVNSKMRSEQLNNKLSKIDVKKSGDSCKKKI